MFVANWKGRFYSSTALFNAIGSSKNGFSFWKVDVLDELG